MLRALDLARALAAGQLHLADVLARCAQAVEQHEGQVRAFTHLDLEAALAQAGGPTSALAGASSRQGPLFGLPFGLKDIIDTASLPTGYGSPIHAAHQPASDAAIVVEIARQGGVVLGKTVTTEFAYLSPPITRNPHDLARSPGGSSSGSAAAVAAGMVPLALGTQTGGSVIRPASYCGVAAIKPSYRLLPITGVKPFAPLLDTLGLFGARVADIAFALSALTQRDCHVADKTPGVPVFGVTRQPFAGEAEAAAQQALEAAIRAVRTAGAQVVDLDQAGVLPDAFAQAFAAHRVINNVEGAFSLAYEHRYFREALSPILLEALDDGRACSMAHYDSARGIANRARKAAKDWLAGVDAVLTYPAPGVAPMPETTGTSQFNRLITLLGLPAVHVPFTRQNGLPMGVQVFGRFGADAATLAAAHWLEGFAQA